MKKATHRDGEMRDHYDFTDGARGKYARRYAEGTNVVVLDPDVALLFPNREAVNTKRYGPLPRLFRYKSAGEAELTKPLHLTAARLRIGTNARGLVRVVAGNRRR